MIVEIISSSLATSMIILIFSSILVDYAKRHILGYFILESRREKLVREFLSFFFTCDSVYVLITIMDIESSYDKKHGFLFFKNTMERR